jgi:hypothetical protein
MSHTRDGGPAFPQIETEPQLHRFGCDDTAHCFGSVTSVGGMSLRDYFAAKAMGGRVVEGNFYAFDRPVADQCYVIADAMLAARETKGGTS